MPLRSRCAAAPGAWSWERLGRIALLGKASEILTKSLPKASRDLPELTLALLELMLALLGLILGLLGLMLALLGLILNFLELMLELLGLSWRSRGAPGGVLGGPKWLQERSRRPSRRPPGEELDV